MNIALIGYGKMGREIEQVCLQRGHTIASRIDIESPWRGEDIGASVAIDFSTASCVAANVQHCCERGMNIVIGTTGWNDQRAAIAESVHSAAICAVWGSNYSIGMQMFFRIVKHAAALANDAIDYDLMIHELHHHRKADSPSGTALSLAEIVLQNVQRKKSLLTETSHTKISPEQLHISSTRGGEIAGTHTLYIDSLADSIELTHRAKSRSGFALGAVLAAEWADSKKGFFDFSDVFDEVIAQTRG